MAKLSRVQALAVHPHSRGEHLRRCGDPGVDYGSSPLTRGTRRRAAPRLGRRRFIPTHAGNTRSGSKRYQAPGGSSPLTRGTPRRLQGRHAQGRFIPTHAGNTVNGTLIEADRTVHPHSRGEHRCSAAAARRRCGSSPLTRGTLVEHFRATALARFIPTHAGNTHRGMRQRRRTAVHPHSRGEHTSRSTITLTAYGSSPLTRGTLWSAGPTALYWRFIPTHAGNTPLDMMPTWMRPVHPHSRGEHTALSAAARVACGSSPLTRGTQVSAKVGKSRSRFIPTHAGNTANR